MKVHILVHHKLNYSANQWWDGGCFSVSWNNGALILEGESVSYDDKQVSSERLHILSRAINKYFTRLLELKK